MAVARSSQASAGSEDERAAAAARQAATLKRAEAAERSLADTLAKFAAAETRLRAEASAEASRLAQVR